MLKDKLDLFLIHRHCIPNISNKFPSPNDVQSVYAQIDIGDTIFETKLNETKIKIIGKNEYTNNFIATYISEKPLYFPSIAFTLHENLVIYDPNFKSILKERLKTYIKFKEFLDKVLQEYLFSELVQIVLKYNK